MARDLEGALEMEVAGALLLNGSMIQDAASPTLGQRLLAAPSDRSSPGSSERFFRQQFGSIFSPGPSASPTRKRRTSGLSICAGGGRTIAHKTIR